MAEAHLSGWHAATVADGRAWAAVPLAPVLRVGEIAVPRFLDLRQAVDRAFGAGGARIGYGRGAEGAWTIRIDDPGPLSRLAPLIGGIAGLEIISLTRGDELWLLDNEGRIRPSVQRTTKGWAVSSTWFATAIWNSQAETARARTTWSAAGCCRAGHGDQGQLVGMLDEINETFGVEPAVVLADAGYCNEPDLLELEDRGIDAHVALGREGKSQVAVDPARLPATHRMGEKLASPAGKARYRNTRPT